MKKESSGAGAETHSWKPRAPELEPEPCSWKEELRSRSCVIFTTAPQPCSQPYWNGHFLWYCIRVIQSLLLSTQSRLMANIWLSSATLLCDQRVLTL